MRGFTVIFQGFCHQIIITQKALFNANLNSTDLRTLASQTSPSPHTIKKDSTPPHPHSAHTLHFTDQSPQHPSPRPPHSVPLSTQCPLKECLSYRHGIVLPHQCHESLVHARNVTNFSISSSLKHVLPSVKTRFAHELIRSQKLEAINDPIHPSENMGHFGKISIQRAVFVLVHHLPHYHTHINLPVLSPCQLHLLLHCCPELAPAVPPTPSETPTQPSAAPPPLPSPEPPTPSACTTTMQAVAV